MADAIGAVQRMLAEHLFEVDEFARSATDFKRVATRMTDGDACRVIAAVLETPKPLDDDRDYLFGTDVADNSAHAWILTHGGAEDCTIRRPDGSAE